MAYLNYDKKVVDFHDLELVRDHYQQGYIFGRVSPGYLYQTRSLRIDLSKFSPNSENRRILKKIPVEISGHALPIAKADYNWRIHKLGKDFYHQKFTDVEFSAAKIKTILCSGEYHFNLLLKYAEVGYAIVYQQETFLHYCYPFYDLSNNNSNNLGMYMMLQAILWAQLHGEKYIYLGSISRPSDKYKLQFSGLEFWHEDKWQSDILLAKKLLQFQK